MKPLVPIALLLSLTARLTAQQTLAPTTPQQSNPLRQPVADTGAFAPLDLPDPNDLRRPSGAPGAAYWQQKVDYSISATLDTTAKRLDGTVTIIYNNRSPDPLPYLWFQMDQNLFRTGSVGSQLNAASSRFGAQNFSGGFEIDSIAQVTIAAARAGAPRARTSPPRPVTTRVDGTMMRVDLATPVPAGGSTSLRIVYHFNIPEHGADRMGREGSLYEMAQWYPRLAVYDDLQGWNTDPYLGQGEFYLEYGDIDFAVTLPAGYIMAGSGTLQNPLEVLTAAQRSRLALAARSDTTIRIVTAEEIRSGAARPRSTGTLTWKFKAENVRDVAWTAAPDYQWDASSWDGILAQAYYRPASARNWSRAADMSRFSIKEYSTRWFRYPYPQISAVEGPVSGMEYPMLAMESNGGSPQDLYNVVTHEIGHNWFPMIVGSNERLYAWMDEGFNTFINTFSEEGYWKRDDSNTRKGEMAFVLQNDQSPTAQPIITAANRYRNNNNLGSLAYVKPSIMLLTLRNKVLGPEVFDEAFREYIQRWAFKHPHPADFIRTMNNASGQRLDWFWREWIYSTAALDQGIETVNQRTQGASNVARITLRNAGQQVMPVELMLTLQDSTTQVVKLPVEIWYNGDRYVAVVTTPKPVIAAQLNPDGMWPDVNPANNAWRAQTP